MNDKRPKTWQGVLRDDGRKGVRDIVLVIYTVMCSRHVAEKIVEGAGDDVHLVGFDGCTDNAYAIRLLLSLVRHPNVGAVLCVGLGCEYTQPEKLAEKAAQSGRPAEWFFIQESGGTAAGIEKGKDALRRLRERRDAARRPVEMTPADLVVGTECGGSDFTSGMSANALVGGFMDRLVDAGGTGVFEEIVELVGLRNILLERAADERAREELARAYDKAMAYCKSVDQYSISSGNFVGGLTTIEEKSMGSMAKSGTRPIRGVIKVAQRPPGSGLWLMDTVPDPHFMQFGYTNPNDTEGIMDLISAGSQVLLFTTGRGSCIGSPIAPLIKITGNEQTYRNLKGDMDVNAGRILSGEATMEQAADELESRVYRVAAGEQTKPERLGHREQCVLYKYQNPAQPGGRCPG